MTIPSRLKGLGFEDAPDGITQRLVASISGLEKQGKTHFALTAPDPIAIFNLDIGMEGVANKFRAQGKEIAVYDTIIPVADEAEKEWEKLEKAYWAVLKDKWVRTVVLDTATEIWELLRLARFGKLTQVMPYHYGPVNAEYRKLIKAAYDTDKNLILLHKMKPKYVNDKRTAEYERAGFGDTGFLVQVNAQVYRDLPDEGETNPAFNLYVKDCRQNAELVGMELAGDMCTWDMLESMVLMQ
jgi:hypothetical protein